MLMRNNDETGVQLMVYEVSRNIIVSTIMDNNRENHYQNRNTLSGFSI